MLLLLPAALIMLLAFLLPMAGLAVESFRLFTPGRVGAAADAPFTLGNYTDLLNLPFVGLFAETLRISILASLVGLVVAYPLAWHIVRRWSRRLRALTTGFMVTLLLLSMLVRTYAIELTFGSVSILRPVLRAVGISPNSGWYIECLVGGGLLHYVIPVATLTLLGTVQNIDPRLIEAAQSLGAPAWRAHLTVTLPLSRAGLVGAFLIGLTFSISAFVIPMVLGKGRVLFLSNSIYNRFSELADYPSGAAIAMVMLAVSLALVVAVSRLAAPRRVRA
jgi:ABC-type spermidine/putrescine transport system permease subunit I